MAGGQFETHGAQPQKPPKYVPIFQDRYFTGLYTQRNVLHDPSDFVTSKFYGGRPDALWMGSNCELTNRLTLQRRPGLSEFSTVLYPSAPLRAFSFELSNGTIQVLVDTGTTGNLAISSVASSIGSTAVYTGVFPNGGSNAYVGMIFQVTGFVTNPSNNGTFTCTASSTTTLTLANANAISETAAAVAVSTGAVYVDNQNGTKTLLFGKAVGAGQTHFISVAGILYMGDGVDIRKYTPGNTNGTIWNWGIVAPSNSPQVQVVQSGSASVLWQASTVWSTMGLIYDSTSGTMLQLHSVNFSGSNTTQFGTTGPGVPTGGWNTSFNGTTTDGSVTWQNNGTITSWSANTRFASVFAAFGNLPEVIYDPVTKSVYVNVSTQSFSNFTGYYTGSQVPNFKAGNGQTTSDNQCLWQYVGTPGTLPTWQASHVYPTFLVSRGNPPVGNYQAATISEPLSLKYGLPASQPIYWQVVKTGGTSGSGGTAPFGNTVVLAGQLIGDNGDTIWLSLGSGTWSAATAYSAWSASGTVFSAIKDTNGNFQVCTTTGTSSTVEPGTSFTLSAAGNASAGDTSYTGTFSPTIPVGATVTISGFVNSVNNGTFQVVSCSSTTLVVTNASGTAESHVATAVFNPSWGSTYGAITKDGSVVWTCVGTSMGWTANTQWYLPATGFYPPQTSGVSSASYGGASIIDSNNDIEFVINSGLGGLSQPTWNSIGSYTSDGGTAYTLTQVAVSGSTVTYTGTITGGGSNAFVGMTFLIAGFTTAGNNVLINVTASTATTLVCSLTSQVNETHAATATTGAIWYNLEQKPTQSLSWTKGYVYAYSYKARSLTDFYSVSSGSPSAIPIPPGQNTVLPPPTGSETGAISTASPVFTITGANAGAVNTVAGSYSSDPQVDTIVIWRSADGGSSDTMFELTEIPNIPSQAGSGKYTVNGVKEDWVFPDFLPDVPTTVGNTTFPGLNPLIPAPINGSNNPPPTAFLPMAYNFERIWGADGQTVPFSGGPDVVTGNPNEAFNPVDELPFLANVIRLVRTSSGLVTFLTDSIEIIAGGPSTASFYSVTLSPGTGLASYNALDQFAGEIYFFSSDNRLVLISPNLNMSNSGFPIGDQLANLPSSGISDTTWNPANVYVAILQNGIDNCLILADGSTGWYRQNPHQVPGAAQGPEPIWSPFANITNGCQMVQTVETSPGVRKLLVGATTGGKKILYRNLAVFTDDGTQYDAFFVMGSIMLVHPGQIAAVKFIEADFSGVSYKPTVSYLMDELSGTFTPFTANPVFDPPSLYGTTITPKSYSPNRYYLSSTASVARARHMQIKVDLGTTATGDEIYNLTIFGRIFVEK